MVWPTLGSRTAKEQNKTEQNRFWQMRLVKFRRSAERDVLFLTLVFVVWTAVLATVAYVHVSCLR